MFNSKENIPPDLLGRYQEIEIAGKGGMGVVFSAHDTVLDKRVAIKTLAEGMSEKSIIRFQKEAKAAGRLNHPNIVSVLDFGIAKSGSLYLIMEYVDGVTLQDTLKEGNLEFGAAVNIFLDIARGLSHAHEKGVIHRDIKPSNIILEKSAEEGSVAKIIDFGIADLRKTDSKGMESSGKSLVGSPAYMSPEVANGKKATALSDIYSFGCLMFEGFTGRQPFEANSAIEMVKAQVESSPPSLVELMDDKLKAEKINPLVLKCLEKDPDSRYSNFGELIKELEMILEELFLPVRKPQESRFHTEVKKTSWKRRLSIFAVLISAILIPSAIYDSVIKKKFKPTNRDKLAQKQQHAFTEDYKPSIVNDLSDVYMGGSNSITDEDVIKGNVKDFDKGKLLLGNCTEITNKALKSLKGKKINYLDLSYTSVNDNGMIYLKDVIDLYKLKLNGLTEISDRGVEQVKELKFLRSLSLDSTGITDKSLKYLSSMNSVTDLSLTGCPKITDSGVEFLESSRLETFSISHTKISSKAVCGIKSLKNLRARYLGWNDNDVENLIGLKKLIYLTLQGNEITIEGLCRLAQNLPELKVINITDCKELSKSDISYFKSMYKIHLEE